MTKKAKKINKKRKKRYCKHFKCKIIVNHKTQSAAEFNLLFLKLKHVLV